MWVNGWKQHKRALLLSHTDPMFLLGLIANFRRLNKTVVKAACVLLWLALVSVRYSELGLATQREMPWKIKKMSRAHHDSLVTRMRMRDNTWHYLWLFWWFVGQGLPEKNVALLMREEQANNEGWWLDGFYLSWWDTTCIMWHIIGMCVVVGVRSYTCHLQMVLLAVVWARGGTTRKILQSTVN